jgi:hypothetical protein
MANVDMRRGGMLYVTVFDPEGAHLSLSLPSLSLADVPTAQSVLNEAILRAGLGRVQRATDPRSRELVCWFRCDDDRWRWTDGVVTGGEAACA